MSQIARTVEGTGKKADVPLDSPSPFSALNKLPEFIPNPEFFERPIFQASPLPPELEWHREGESDHACGPEEPKPDPDSAFAMPGSKGLRLAGARVGRPAPAAAGPSGSGAIHEALRWLARHQSPDGTWRAALPCGDCLPNPGEADFDPGVTALALLAFSRAGYLPALDDEAGFGAVMRKTIAALVARQDPEGCIGSRNAQKYMYNHVFATLALVEATRHSSLFRDEVRDAAGFLLRSQNPGRGWRYSYLCGDNDTSVTSWAVQALRATEPFSDGDHRGAYAGAIAWFDEVTEEAYGRVGYHVRSPGCKLLPFPDPFDYHESVTALASAARWPLDGGRTPRAMIHSVDLLGRDRPRWGATSTDFYYWHAGTLAFKAVDGGRGKRWEAWKEATVRAIVPNQNARPGECRDGSWDPVDRWSESGGRVYATSINALTLEALR